MKILYIANVRLPTEKAHGIQIMKMCEAFARAGAQIELVVPSRRNAIHEDPFDYYGVKRIFTITTLPALDFVGWGRVGFLIRAFSFAHAARRYLRQAKPSFVYSRDKIVLMILSSTTPFVWEVHTKESQQVLRILGRKAKAIVAITYSFAALCRSLGVPKEKIVVAHDGVDLEQFSLSISKKDARHKFGLPLDRRLVVYAGHLYSHKGADTLAQSARLFAPNMTAVIIGGTETDLQRFRADYGDVKNLLIIGQRPHTDIPYYLKAADVLVLPNSAASEVSRLYTSPMKLFEYMAAERPIVASDVPSVREVLNEETAYLVEPDSPHALMLGIQWVIENQTEALTRAHTAHARTQQYSWDARAHTILTGIPNYENSSR